VVFPLGMYVVVTHEYSTVAHLPYLEVIPSAMFWGTLLAWILSIIGMHMRPFGLRPVSPDRASAA
jgi:tellurite resistance protein TehA-like permease